MLLSKRQAIRESAKYVSVTGRGTSWQITEPWAVEHPAGPTTRWSAGSYAEAKWRAKQTRALIALHFLGALDENSAYAVYITGDEPLPVLVDLGLAAYKTDRDCAIITSSKQPT